MGYIGELTHYTSEKRKITKHNLQPRFPALAVSSQNTTHGRHTYSKIFCCLNASRRPSLIIYHEPNCRLISRISLINYKYSNNNVNDQYTNYSMRTFLALYIYLKNQRAKKSSRNTMISALTKRYPQYQKTEPETCE